MSIILFSLRAYGDYATEFGVEGADARRVAAVLAHPGAEHVTKAIVTFYHEGLTNDDSAGKFKGDRDDLDELSLFDLSSCKAAFKPLPRE